MRFTCISVKVMMNCTQGDTAQIDCGAKNSEGEKADVTAAEADDVGTASSTHDDVTESANGNDEINVDSVERASPHNHVMLVR